MHASSTSTRRRCNGDDDFKAATDRTPDAASRPPAGERCQCRIAEIVELLAGGPLPAAILPRVRRQLGGSARRRRSASSCKTPRGHDLPRDRARRPRARPRLHRRRPRHPRRAPRRPLRAAHGARRRPAFRRPSPAAVARDRPLSRGRAPAPIAPPPQEVPAALAPRRRGTAAQQDPRRRGDPPPLRRLEHVLRVGARPVDDLHVRVLPRTPTRRSSRRRRTSTGWCSRSSAASRATGCSTSAAGGAAWCGTPPGGACTSPG